MSGPVDRREFLILTAAAFASLAVGGCGSSGQEPGGNKVLSDLVTDINLIYPQIAKFPVLSSIRFNAGGADTQMYNLASSDLRIQPMQTVFDYYAKFIKDQPTLSYSVLGRQVPYKVDTTNVQRRLMFFVPQNTSSPPWDGISNNATAGSMILKDKDRKILGATFVKVPDSDQTLPYPDGDFPTRGDALARSFMVEACQTTVNVGTYGQELAGVGQEVTCNSLGSALALRQRNEPYQVYRDYILKTYFSLSPTDRVSYLLLSEPKYAEIPIAVRLVA